MNNESFAAAHGDTHARFGRTAFRIGLAVAGLLVVAGIIGVVMWKDYTTPRQLQLADGTAAYFLGDTQVTPATDYPQRREITVDGDVFMAVAANAQPLTVRSRLLVLTVTGKTAFRMTAYAKEAGEQVEVLYGHVTAHKSYDSPYQEPDVLTGGEMTMINRDIDLMEKETTDIGALCDWSRAITRHNQEVDHSFCASHTQSSIANPPAHKNSSPPG